MSRFLSQKSLQPFIDKGKRVDHFVPIICYDQNKIKIHGYEATLLADICNVYLEARRNIRLSIRQAMITSQCEMLLSSFAKVGIIALIDEATGYQQERLTASSKNYSGLEVKSLQPHQAKTLIEKLKSKSQEINWTKLKLHLLKQDQEFWDKFEQWLRIERTTTARQHRLPLTLTILKSWKKKWVKLKSKEKPASLLEPKKVNLGGESYGSFIYYLKSNRLFFSGQELTWERKSKLGGDWFSGNETSTKEIPPVKIELKLQPNWQMLARAKINNNSYQAYFSYYQTRKVAFSFQSWDQTAQKEKLQLQLKTITQLKPQELVSELE